MIGKMSCLQGDFLLILSGCRKVLKSMDRGFSSRKCFQKADA